MKKIRTTCYCLFMILMSSITFAQQDSIVEAVILDSADIAADIAYNTGVSDLEQKKYKKCS